MPRTIIRSDRRARRSLIREVLDTMADGYLNDAPFLTVEDLIPERMVGTDGSVWEQDWERVREAGLAAAKALREEDEVILIPITERYVSLAERGQQPGVDIAAALAHVAGRGKGKKCYGFHLVYCEDDGMLLVYRDHHVAVFNGLAKSAKVLESAAEAKQLLSRDQSFRAKLNRIPAMPRVESGPEEAAE